MEGVSVPYLKVTDSRLALAKLASAFYGHPDRKHIVIGITGTNGKTTTAYMLRHVLEWAGMTCSLVGTVSHCINGKEIEFSHTTPNALEVQQLLSESKDEVFVMEVSSHGLKQHRVGGIRFNYGVFTNLSHDHLDYHDNLYDYFEAKTKLFNFLKLRGEAIVGSHCEWGKRLINHLIRRQIPVHSFGEEQCDDIRVKRVLSHYPACFELQEGKTIHSIRLSIPGCHNIWNAATAFLTARRMGIHAEHIIQALTQFPGVPGRFETFVHPSGAKFIIDYAHTPDALYYCLKTAKQGGAKRVIHIFGFREDRDPSKRGEMASVSSELSDMFYPTLSDKQGETIDKRMLQELYSLNDKFGGGEGIVMTDRTLAIQKAWEQAGEGDWILITGKGPNNYKVPFSLPGMSDKETILALQDAKKGSLIKMDTLNVHPGESYEAVFEAVNQPGKKYRRWSHD